jgi:hypothetical protein
VMEKILAGHERWSQSRERFGGRDRLCGLPLYRG